MVSPAQDDAELNQKAFIKYLIALSAVLDAQAEHCVHLAPPPQPYIIWRSAETGCQGQEGSQHFMSSSSVIILRKERDFFVSVGD